jgi:hypothetical protein
VAPLLVLPLLGFRNPSPCRESSDGRFGDRGGEGDGDDGDIMKFLRGETCAFRSLLEPVEETDESDELEDTERAEGLMAGT